MSIRDWFRIPPLLAALLLVTGCTSTTEPSAGPPEAAPPMDTLVTVDWLVEHLDDPDLVVLDCTVTVEPVGDGDFQTVNGRPNYEAGHIPGAGFADLMGELSDHDSPFEHDLPAPEQFAAAMGSLGVGDDTRVVLYDNYNSAWAARVWWMLRWIGFDEAAVLDGGLKAWKDAGQPLSTEPARHPGRSLGVDLRPGLFTDRDEVHSAIGDDAVNIIDALPEGHYRGDWAMYDRPGHIASATNVPVTSLTDSTGRYKSADELAAMFGYERDARNILYCGGGIAASSNALVMTRLGFTDVAVYVPSLQEWAADPELPMETATEFDEFPE